MENCLSRQTANWQMDSLSIKLQRSCGLKKSKGKDLFQIWCLYLSYKESYEQNCADVSFWTFIITCTIYFGCFRVDAIILYTGTHMYTYTTVRVLIAMVSYE